MTPMEPDSLSWIRVFVAFVIVFGLMALLGYVLKYINQRGMTFPGIKNKAQRLQIVESLTLDVRRRLVIVRRDDVEHLLLLGANQDIVVESDLTQSQTLSSKSAT